MIELSNVERKRILVGVEPNLSFRETPILTALVPLFVDISIMSPMYLIIVSAN